MCTNKNTQWKLDPIFGDYSPEQKKTAIPAVKPITKELVDKLKDLGWILDSTLGNYFQNKKITAI